MSSTPRTRPRPKSKQRNPSPPSFALLKEPSPGFFPSKEEILKLFVVVAIAISVAMACNYIVSLRNRPPKPFCDSHGASDYFFSSGHNITDFCEACPNNGKCSEGKLECFHGYKKHGRLCVADGEVNQTAKELSQWVEHHICEAYTRFLCDGTGTIWFQEAEILKELDEHESKESFGLRNDTFIYAKQKAIETIESYVEARVVFDGIKELKCPDGLAEHYTPLLCRVRQWLYTHALFILVVSALLLGFIRILWRVRRSQQLSARAEQLYEQVCDILEENAMEVKGMSSGGEPWVVASRLRDHLLLRRERKDAMLWKKVEELVQEDSRLDQYPKLVKGEQKIVWEWQDLHHARMRRKTNKDLEGSGGTRREGLRNFNPKQK